MALRPPSRQTLQIQILADTSNKLSHQPPNGKNRGNNHKVARFRSVRPYHIPGWSIHKCSLFRRLPEIRLQLSRFVFEQRPYDVGPPLASSEDERTGQIEGR